MRLTVCHSVVLFILIFAMSADKQEYIIAMS